MPDLTWNYATWNDSHDWSAAGEEWSVAWGGAPAQWYGTILPRIHRFIPANNVLEIAPGQGRWTQFLLRNCVRYFGVDLSEKCVEFCERRFSAFGEARFIRNDGKSLTMIPDHEIDFVFSFDSLVHVEADVIRDYIWQICQKLVATGVAFLHHSNAASPASDPVEARRGARAMSVSSELIRQLIEDCSGVVLIQEEINWVGASRTDCLTTFTAGRIPPAGPPQFVANDNFLAEAELVRRFQSAYAKL